MKEFSISLGGSLLWTGLYFGIMIFYTSIDIAVWRKLSPKYSGIANLITVALCIGGFLLLLRNAGFQPYILSHFTLTCVFYSIFCSVLLFIVMDNGLDRVFESLFPKSQQHYQESVHRLRHTPVASFIQICLFAPVIEELFMRGFLLSGLKASYGAAAALLLSSAIFAVLHFNIVQILSAFLCGIVLGLLCLQTDSVLCCIIAHSGYNILSCAAIMRSASSPPA